MFSNGGKLCVWAKIRYKKVLSRQVRVREGGRRKEKAVSLLENDSEKIPE